MIDKLDANKPRENEEIIFEKPIIEDNRCVCCGDIIPEGRQVCYICEKECF